ncbi:sensor domain-containing diguanylate cyclase [Anoxynatronum buryatiense]|uniref:Diguanylate cyclase (GGDEF) domain-containing protein n=1 Tax=Anoxynatronum buryatiense TaxID=489973 RepID=A0AA46AKD3_9CLOT|nr:GGDEF domain-containing protein [Anoxynatronum buryatiense]SMP69507.1 diguanylate cyclase (GGDEF) domain-containing protein [Anoxynatronum buryatiense]
MQQSTDGHHLDRYAEKSVGELNALAEKVERSNPADSLAYAQKAYALAVESGDLSGQMKSLLNIGRSYWLGGKLNQAVQELTKGLELAKAVEEHRLEVEILNALGNVYLYMQNFDRTLEFYGQGLKLADAIHYERMAAGLLNNFGEVYKILKDYGTALMYYHESLSRHKRHQRRADMAFPLVNIGMVYCEMGDLEKARQYAGESLQVSRLEDHFVGEGYSLHLMGKIAHRQGLLEESIELYQRCLNILSETADVNLRLDLCVDLYHATKEAGDSHQALTYLLRGLSIAKGLEIDILIVKFYSLIATHYEAEGDLGKSVLYYKKYHNIHKQMAEVEQQNKLRSIAFQMEADEYLEKHRAYEVLTEQLKEQASRLELQSKALKQSYEQMQIISEIGQKITATLNINHVFEQIYQHTNSLMEADVLGIGVYRNNEDVLEYPFYMEKGQVIPTFSIPLSSETSYAVWCLKNRREVFVNDLENEYQHYIKGYESTSGELMPSLLFCPLMVNEQVIGVMTVQSRRKDAYTQYNLDTLRILASYAAIAINNARQSQELAQEVTIRQKTQQELEKLNRQLKELSEIDSLTGIANRRKLDAYLQEEWERSRRDQLPVSLILVDVDYFKAFNDQFGHQTGDRILVDVAKTLEQSLRRKTDFIGRYGGDEFAVVLHNTDRGGAVQLAEKIVDNIDDLAIPLGEKHEQNCLTVTLGVATLIPSSLYFPDQLIHAADLALYQAKDRGRNCAVHFDELSAGNNDRKASLFCKPS